MTETLIRSAAATDAALADALDTLATLTLARRHLPHLAGIELSFDNYTKSWQLTTQAGHTPTEAADIDAIRAWADALTGGQTHLSEPYTSAEYSFRTLSATGTLVGSTPVTVWTHVDKTYDTTGSEES